MAGFTGSAVIAKKEKESDDLFSSMCHVFISFLPHHPSGLLLQELYKGLQNDGTESSYSPIGTGV